MLENERLLILPWSSTAGLPREDVAGLRRVRRIQSAAGTLLGFAGWAPQSWWRGQAISVFEIPDASLLMRLHRPWGPLRMWQVSDAEERRIGSIHRQVILDGAGFHLAHLEDEHPSRPQIFLSPHNVELGSLEWLDKESLRLTFKSPANPFVRMDLLGKALLLPAVPH